MRRNRWLIADRVQVSIPQVKPLHFLQVERARAAASKYSELVATFVYGSVAIYAAGDGECRATARVTGDQLRRGLRAESIKLRRCFRRKQLNNFEAVLAVRHQRVLSGCDHADLDVVHIVEI